MPKGTFGFLKGHTINVGRKLSLVTRKRMSAAAKGGVFSEQHRKRISEAQLGEKNHQWKGGITSENTKIRTCYEYKKWRKAVFERDRYKCLFCGCSKSGKMNADHIKRYSDIIKENNIKTFGEALGCKELWDISNGRTLCVSCHKSIKLWTK